MLDVQAIDLHYGAAQALRGVSLQAKVGEVTCVLGRNGVGKTSLLDALAGQQPVSAGSIMWEGEDATRLKPYERARRGIAYVPQGREIFPLLTVEENLKSGFAPLPRDQRGIPDDVFSLFPVLHDMLRRRGGDLSGGQQQQLAIGRALVMRPRLLLLDEPTEGIQPSIIKDIGRAITYLRSLRQMAIVLVEQYLDFASELGDRFRGDGSRRDRLFFRPGAARTRPRSSGRWRSRSGCVPAASALNRIFAANRAAGHIALEVGAQGGVTRRVRVGEDGPLRVRFPGPDSASLEAMIVNTAGGIAGGDRHRLDICGRDTARDLPSPRRRRRRSIARSARHAEIDVRLRVEAGAQLRWLPQETILFDRARPAPPHRSRSVRRRFAADGRGRGVRPLRDGRDGAARHADRPLAAAPRRQAGLRRDRAARWADRATDLAKPPSRTAASRSPPCSLRRPTRRRSSACAARVFLEKSAYRPGTGLRWRGSAPRMARRCAAILAAVLTALGGELPRLWLN